MAKRLDEIMTREEMARYFKKVIKMKIKEFKIELWQRVRDFWKSLNFLTHQNYLIKQCNFSKTLGTHPRT
jgi:hypothetical protein